MRFVSLDVETANADMASICQIGAVRFVDGAVAAEWETYVDPEDYFDPVNVSEPVNLSARLRRCEKVAARDDEMW
jgi:hypothetical protein